MGVEVYVHFQAFVVVGLLDNRFSGRPNGGLLLLARVQIPTVQINSHRIQTVIASGNPVWVEDRNNLEDIVFPQSFTLLTLKTRK